MMEKQQVSALICNYEWPRQNLSSQRQVQYQEYIIKQTSDEDNEKFQ